MGRVGIAVVVTALVFALPLASLWATKRWATRLWARRGSMTFGAKLVVALAILGSLIGCIGTLVGLLRVLGAIGGVGIETSQKARSVGVGISIAMTYAVVGLGIWLPSLFALRYLARKRSN